MNDRIEVNAATLYEVYDPWTAQIRGYTFNKEDAKALKKAIKKRKKRFANKFI